MAAEASAGHAVGMREADENMVSAWERIIAFAPRPGRREADGLLSLSSGIPLALFNPTYVVGEVVDPARAVAGIASYYESLGSPYAVVFLDDAAPGLSAACEAMGMVEHWRMPLMVLDPIPPAPDGAAVEGLTVAPVDASGVEAYVDVLTGAFGMPREIAASMMGEELLLRTPGFTGFLGVLDGAPVAASGVYLTGSTAGVYNVATLPAARGRGVGAAITWAAALAGREAGATRSVLQASEMGAPVYARMGYATPAHYRQFEGVRPS